MGQRFRSGAVLALSVTMGLSGCMSLSPGADGGEVSRMRGGLLAPANLGKAADRSVILDMLSARQSVLPDGSPFDKVAGPVLTANARAAESELRAARLRSEAMDKNWLPTIGPKISLTSLGEVLAGMVIDAVIFDNGKKRAEREFARADVEVAAVNLAIDTNDRVHTALTLYLRRQEAAEKAGMYELALKDLKHFEWVMDQRVKGGISDLSDLSVIRQKLAKMTSERNAEVESANAALAELNAMSVKKLDGVTGLADVRVGRGDAQPLTVMLAEAEKTRAVAGARVDRAGFLPGLKASATVTQDGTTGALDLAPENGIGFGTGASLKAIEAAEEAAGRRVTQAHEEANRRLSRAEAEQAALGRQVAEAGTLSQGAKTNLDLFQKQYDAGQRQVMDVVGVYETWVDQEAQRIALKYKMAGARLEIARELGLLASGSDI